MKMNSLRMAPAYFLLAMIVGIASTWIAADSAQCSVCPSQCVDADLICGSGQCCETVGEPFCPEDFPIYRHNLSKEKNTSCGTPCSRSKSCVSECIPS
jgi:hypothetical protein